VQTTVKYWWYKDGVISLQSKDGKICK
jgi:hypothetical protein